MATIKEIAEGLAKTNILAESLEANRQMLKDLVEGSARVGDIVLGAITERDLDHITTAKDKVTKMLQLGGAQSARLALKTAELQGFVKPPGMTNIFGDLNPLGSSIIEEARRLDFGSFAIKIALDASTGPIAIVQDALLKGTTIKPYWAVDDFLSSNFKSPAEQFQVTLGDLGRIQYNLFENFQIPAEQLRATVAAVSNSAVTEIVSDVLEFARQCREACEILEVDPDSPNEYYEQIDPSLFWNEVAAVRWMKQTAAQGRMQSLEAILQLGKLTSEGKLSYPTLERFKHLLIGQPAGGEIHVSKAGAYVEIEPSPTNQHPALWVPANCRLELEISDPMKGLSRFSTDIGTQGANVSARIEGKTPGLWRIVTLGQIAAKQPLIGTQTPKREPDKCNQWLFVEYFDKQRTNLKGMVEEWLHIRRTQDYKEQPHNPLRSMQTAISEEKKRRQEL